MPFTMMLCAARGVFRRYPGKVAAHQENPQFLFLQSPHSSLSTFVLQHYLLQGRSSELELLTSSVLWLLGGLKPTHGHF